MRLIDADALYETISDHVTTVSVCPTVDWAMGKQAMKEIALEDIDNAPTINCWISVKDKLPEDEYECLLITEDCWYYIGWFAGDIQKWVVDGGVECDEEVTYWIKLPEPPKEDEDDAER